MKKDMFNYCIAVDESNIKYIQDILFDMNFIWYSGGGKKYINFNTNFLYLDKKFFNRKNVITHSYYNTKEILSVKEFVNKFYRKGKIKQLLK